MINISEFFIRKVITTTLLVVAIVLFGVFAYFNLPVSNLPSIEYPVITIEASYPGANPEIMAAKIATPLEEECMKIPGLHNVISTSTDGSTEIVLNFDPNENVDLMAPDVQSAVLRAKENMPQLRKDPTFSKRNPSNTPIIQYVFYSGTLDRKALFDLIHKRVVQELQLIEGVSNVGVFADPYAIRIKLDPEKMASCHITISDIKEAINNSNLILPGGCLRGKYGNISINPQGQLTIPEAYNNLIIKYNPTGNPVILKNIGEAYASVESEIFYPKLYMQGKDITNNLVFIQVYKKPGVNTIEVARKAKALIERVRLFELPKLVEGSFIVDFSQTVKESIFEVKETLFFSFILVIIVLLLFFGRMGDTIIPGVIMPITILATCIIMYFVGFSIDNLSLLAIILAIGFIVDDSIVILENTMRHIENGLTPFDASIRSSREVTGSVISMCVSIMVVFIPIVFMPGIVGKNFREFALTVIFMVICSGIVSLCLTPMMNAHMLRPINKQNESRILKITNKFLAILIKKYSVLLKRFLMHPYLSLIMWILCLICSFIFYFLIPKTFIPPGDSGVVEGSIVAPLGVSSEQIQKYQKCIYNLLKKDPNIVGLFTFTGFGVGMDQSNGYLAFPLIPKSKRKPIDQIIQDIQKQISQIPYNLGTVYLSPWPVLAIDTGGRTTASGSQYSYLISGTDKKTIDSCAVELTNRLKNLPEFTSVQNNVKLDMPQLKVHILRDKAAQLGITVSQIGNALSDAFSLGKVADYTEGSQQYNVYIQEESKYGRTIDDLARISLHSSRTDSVVPLSTLVQLEKAVGPQEVVHYNQLNTATISFNLAAGIPLNIAVAKINKITKEILPVSVVGAFEGTASQYLSTLKSLAFLIFISIFLLYVALGILYESYIHPFTVLTTLPTATVGGLGFLFICGSELSLFAYIGMFMLIGIVVKNGIIMVDFALQNIRNEGVSSLDAIYNACRIRFRPILMTGMTSMAAAIPIIVGLGNNGAIRRSLGIVVLGGLVVSQLLTLFVTPGFFIYMQKIQERHLNKYRLTRSHHRIK